MTKKTACLISCSDHYGHRMHVTDNYLRSRGYETIYITSDFDHTSKSVFRCNVQNCVQIHARPYYKNLSLDRILSHWEFARDVFRYIETLPKEPDVIVALIPPNFLAHYGAKYKKQHPNVKLIFDIFDMWPETFPFGKLKKLLAPVFFVWSWIRDHSLNSADYVITECEMFRNLLNLPDDQSKTVYLCAKPLEIPKQKPQLRDNAIELCYLGAINNIISIPDICGLISELVMYKPVTLHIVGKGEREKDLIEAAKMAGAEVVFYGAVYDDAKKLEIMSKCHFGLNIMKSSVCIGLTMKSVEYFRFGLPIINNIPGDTSRMVQERGIGIALGSGCVERLTSLSVKDCENMRNRVEDTFCELFAESQILQMYEDTFNTMIP